jgi:purine-binding chemotaxis protein CheW
MKQNNEKTINSQHAANYLPKSTAAKSILMERAKNLAEKTQVEVLVLNRNQYICFGLGKNHLFGIDYKQVKEVIHTSSITALPLTPDYIAGVLNYRGHLISIIELGKLFGLPAASVIEGSHVMIVQIKQMTIGLLISFIENSKTYDADALEPSLAVNNKLKQKYVLGLHQGTIAILNIDAILQDFRQDLQSLALGNKHSSTS